MADGTLTAKIDLNGTPSDYELFCVLFSADGDLKYIKALNSGDALGSSYEVNFGEVLSTDHAKIIAFDTNTLSTLTAVKSLGN